MTRSRLVVLGCCGAWPEAGSACSGFVLEHEGFRIVLDLGYATLPRLLSLIKSSVGDGIDAVVVTHHHPDHAVDLHGLFRARWFGSRGSAPIPLYAPVGVMALLEYLEDGASEEVHAVFDWHEIPGSGQHVGPFELTSRLLPHFVPNAGVRLQAPGLTVAYTGDTGPSPLLADLGRDADLFIVEASDRDQQPATPAATSDVQLHMSARDAGAAATAAGARRLLLTHFWPGNDRERSRSEAAERFTGDILLADDGLVVPL